jgi:hypothetical protein
MSINLPLNLTVSAGAQSIQAINKACACSRLLGSKLYAKQRQPNTPTWFDRRDPGDQAVSRERSNVEVQQTTFSLDVVGRYVRNTLAEAVNNGGRPFDVVVLGAGMFGAYCAGKIYHLGARDKRVLLLEAGAFLVSERVKNWLGSGLMLRTRSAAIQAHRASGFGAMAQQ